MRLQTLKYLSDELHSDFLIFYYDFMCKAFKKKHSYFDNKAHNRCIKKYKKKYSEYIEILNSKYNKVQEIVPSKNIWVFWYQGLENAPEVVKIGIDSIKTKYNDHNVVIITKDNLENYLSIPERIKSNINKGKLTYTNFSDYLRLGLLKKYGGAWIDSTCFINKKIDFEKYSFYSIHHDLYSNWHVCRGKWTSFFLYSIKNDNLISFSFDFMNNYLKTHNRFPTYLWIDCIFRIAYETNDVIKNEIDAVPVNNKGVLTLSDSMESNKDISNFNYSGDVYKLFWKIHYPVDKMEQFKKFVNDNKKL